MSFLTDQQPGSLFSELGELSLAPGGGPQSWDPQPKAHAGSQRALLVRGAGSTPLTPLTPRTDQDKLSPSHCDIEIKGSGMPLTAGGSNHGTSLGSAGESPDSPSSSSPSPSPVSPVGCLTAALGLQMAISPPLAPGLPCVDPPSPPSPAACYPVGAPLMGGISPTEAFSHSDFGKASVPQQAAGEGRTGVIDNNNDVEEEEEQKEVMAGAEVTPGALQLSKSSSPDRSQEEGGGGTVLHRPG
ncbi:hypothetical protein NHX12_021550 [Muraenolepis orangiensis]|uniref:Uncharacterized protein n=1 Tax=Muraenolepis orangiensis TaxID=630683 RepID=A0A9Q0EQC7_9TELE|nr:hypothetical protein NHX12_021550 [Muraenolepis orangiensis]